MKHYNSLITFLFLLVSFSAFSQQGGIKTYAETRCRVDNGEPILVEYSVETNSLVCCYDDVTGKKFDKCPDYELCISPVFDKQCWAVVDSNNYCTYGGSSWVYATQISPTTGLPYPLFLRQNHIDEFFVNGMLVPLPNYPYISNSASSPQLYQDLTAYLIGQGYDVLLADGGSIVINNSFLTFEYCGEAWYHEVLLGGAFSGDSTLVEDNVCFDYTLTEDCDNQISCRWYDVFVDSDGVFQYALDSINNVLTEMPEGAKKLPCPLTIKEPLVTESCDWASVLREGCDQGTSTPIWWYELVDCQGNVRYPNGAIQYFKGTDLNNEECVTIVSEHELVLSQGAVSFNSGTANHGVRLTTEFSSEADDVVAIIDNALDNGCIVEIAVGDYFVGVFGGSGGSSNRFTSLNSPTSNSGWSALLTTDHTSVNPDCPDEQTALYANAGDGTFPIDDAPLSASVKIHCLQKANEPYIPIGEVCDGDCPEDCKIDYSPIEYCSNDTSYLVYQGTDCDGEIVFYPNESSTPVFYYAESKEDCDFSNPQLLTALFTGISGTYTGVGTNNAVANVTFQGTNGIDIGTAAAIKQSLINGCIVEMTSNTGVVIVLGGGGAISYTNQGATQNGINGFSEILFGTTINTTNHIGFCPTHPYYDAAGGTFSSSDLWVVNQYCQSTTTNTAAFSITDPQPTSYEIGECGTLETTTVDIVCIDGFENTVITIIGEDGNIVFQAFEPTLVECGESVELEQKTKLEVCYISPDAQNGIIGQRWDSELNADIWQSTNITFPIWDTHINGVPDESVVITNNWIVNDLDFPITGAYVAGSDTDVSSQELYYAYLNITEPMLLRDNNGNTGELISVFMQDCNKDMVQVVNNYYTPNGLDRNAGTFWEACEGIKKIAIQVQDYSVYGGFTLQYSVDGGTTWINFPITNSYTSNPKIESKYIFCDVDGNLTNVDGTAFTENVVNCNPVCYPMSKPVLVDTEVVITDGCLDVDGDAANYINVTREIIFTDGSPVTTYYTSYGDEVNQAEYNNSNDYAFVNCLTGELIDEPAYVPECEQVNITEAFAPSGTNGMNVERWVTHYANESPTTTASTTPSSQYTGAVDYSGMPAHISGTAPDYAAVETDAYMFDENSQDATRGWFWYYTAVPVRLREFRTTGEAIDYYLGECAGDIQLVGTGLYPNNTLPSDFDVSLSAGKHYIGFEQYDFSVWGFVRYQHSFDGGVTWSDIPASQIYTQEPTLQKCQVQVCRTPEGQNLCTDLKTGELLGSEFTLKEPDLCSGASTIGVPCSDFVIETFYGIEGASATEGTTKIGWENIGLESTADYPANNDDAAICEYMDNFDVSQTPTTPTTILNTGFQVNDIGTAANSNDYEITTAWLIVDEPVYIRWSGGSEGAIKISLGLCGGELVEQFCEARFGDPDSQPIYLPKGIVEYEIINFDHQGTNSSYNAYYSTDGINWTLDNTPPMVQFSTSQPYEICKKVKICKDNSGVTDFLTGEDADLTNCYDCSIACDAPSASSDSGSGGEVTGSVTIDCPDDYQPRQFDNAQTITNVYSLTVRAETGTTTVTLPSGDVQIYEGDTNDVETWIYPKECGSFAGNFTITTTGTFEAVWIEKL